MKLPEEFLQSLEGVPGFDRMDFIAVHEEGRAVTSVRINTSKWKPEAKIFEERSLSTISSAFTGIRHLAVPWCGTGFYLSQRPSFTFDPCFHAGCYYVQEASSMFLEQAFKQLVNLNEPLKILDLCAAPGGKSTHIQSLISADSLLVTNEVIKQRGYVLTDNIIKWGCGNVIVANNDPKAFQRLPGYFDVMVVDAPCSGSGLFRKDADAIDEWSPNNVALCSQRQQRILADALPALKPGGILIYSTCSYSLQEDEEIADWLVEDQQLESLSLKIDKENWSGIIETASEKTASAGYRFYPDKIAGEGFFLSCFQKATGDDEPRKLKPAKADAVTTKEKGIIELFLREPLSFIRFRNEIIAMPETLLARFLELQPLLNIQYAGVMIGDVLKDKLVPHHALAQNNLLANDVAVTEVSYGQAIKYLQRQELSFEPQSAGWQVVRYNGLALGWINALQNRINNYYPKEIRILKAQNDALSEK